MKFMILFLILLSGCNANTSRDPKDLICVSDVGEVTDNIQDHLCYLYEVYDEPCLEREKTKELILRFTKWSVREASEIITIKRTYDDCFILSNKTIPPQHFNALSILVELKEITYKSTKYIVDRDLVEDLTERSEDLFTNIQLGDYQEILYILEFVDNGSLKKFYQVDRLSYEQEDHIKKLVISH